MVAAAVVGIVDYRNAGAGVEHGLAHILGLKQSSVHGHALFVYAVSSYPILKTFLNNTGIETVFPLYVS